MPQRFADDEWLDAPVTDGVSPLTVVDLDGPGAERFGGRPAATAKRVFVALGGRGTALRDALDVAIDDDEDGQIALMLMADTCSIAPQAAAVAAQLMRTADTGTLAEAFWRESVTYSMLLAGPEFRDWRRRHRRRKRSSEEPDDDFPIEVDDQGDVVEIVLNRPHVHNAYSAAMRDALVAILRLLHRAKDRPMVRLRGNGRSFCSGGDLDEFGTTPGVVDAHAIRTARAPGL
ncbi:MAG TPA: enoyl-CoA hydratase/isomerase family protein, partial [Acidimicrobiia bacterium]